MPQARSPFPAYARPAVGLVLAAALIWAAVPAASAKRILPVNTNPNAGTAPPGDPGPGPGAQPPAGPGSGSQPPAGPDVGSQPPAGPGAGSDPPAVQLSPPAAPATPAGGSGDGPPAAGVPSATPSTGAGLAPLGGGGSLGWTPPPAGPASAATAARRAGAAPARVAPAAAAAVLRAGGGRLVLTVRLRAPSRLTIRLVHGDSTIVAQWEKRAPGGRTVIALPAPPGWSPRPRDAIELRALRGGSVVAIRSLPIVG